MKSNLTRKLFLELCDKVYSDVVIGQRSDIMTGINMLKGFLDIRMAQYEKEKLEYLKNNNIGGTDSQDA